MSEFFKWLASLFSKPVSSTPVLVPSPAPVSPSPVVPPPSVAPTQDNFLAAVKYVMKNEDGVDWDHDKGEYTNDPRDPGGRTVWGIIQTEYEAYLGHALDESAMRNMPRSTALLIYRKNFWVPIHGDSYNSAAKATAIMDCAVNKGLGGCMVILKRALGKDFATRYGQDVIDAVNAMPEKQFLQAMTDSCLAYINARISQYPNMAWARAGWTNRAKRMIGLA